MPNVSSVDEALARRIAQIVVEMLGTDRAKLDHQSVPSGEERLVDTPTAAEMIGVSPATLHTWRSRGVSRGDWIPYTKLGGKVLYRVGDLKTFTRSRRFVHSGRRLDPQGTNS